MELKMQQERERRQRKIPPSAGPNDEYALRLSQLRKAMSKPEEPNGWQTSTNTDTEWAAWTFKSRNSTAAKWRKKDTDQYHTAMVSSRRLIDRSRKLAVTPVQPVRRRRATLVMPPRLGSRLRQRRRWERRRQARIFEGLSRKMTEPTDKHRYTYTSGLRALEEGKHSRSTAERRHGMQGATASPPAERQPRSLSRRDSPGRLRGFGKNGAEDGMVANAAFDHGRDGNRGERYHGEKPGEYGTMRAKSPQPKAPRIGWSPERGR
jgi:hypothetical protein